jgi:pimeloyl-ACP methyl ester carboxylesterase
LRRFTASDGAEIGYGESGGGRPLLLLHGLMAHSGFWSAQQPLSDTFRLIAPDFRGHGQSQADPTTVTVDRLTGDVEELAEALDLRSAIVVGWSLGATVSWSLLSGPQAHRFAGSVVVDMTPRVLNGGDWQLGLTADVVETRRTAFREDFRTFALAAGPAILAQPVADGKAALGAWAGDQFARNNSRAIATLWDSLAALDQRALLPQITQPTLIVHGARSQLYEAQTARFLATALPDAQAVQFDGSGHAPHLEQPELFNTRIRAFAANLKLPNEARTLA